MIIVKFTQYTELFQLMYMIHGFIYVVDAHFIDKIEEEKILDPSSCELVRDSSVVRRHYILLLEPSNVRAQYIRKTADLPH